MPFLVEVTGKGFFISAADRAKRAHERSNARHTNTPPYENCSTTAPIPASAAKPVRQPRCITHRVACHNKRHDPCGAPLAADTRAKMLMYSFEKNLLSAQCFQRAIAVSMAGRRVEGCGLSSQGCF